MSDPNAYRRRCKDCGELKWLSAFNHAMPGICSPCRTWRIEMQKWRDRESSARRAVGRAKQRLIIAQQKRRAFEWRRMQVQVLRRNAVSTPLSQTG